MVRPGIMLQDSLHPIFCITDSPPNVAGTTQLFRLIEDSYRHIALFFVADHTLHEPHPIFLKFGAACRPYRVSLRPVILGRAHRIGGLRKPNWADDDILFLATNDGVTERAYGLDGKKQMGLLIIRPDGHIAYSTLVEPCGNALDSMESWIATTLIKS